MNAFKFRETRDESNPAYLREWCAKTPNEFGRLALAFHFIEWATTAEPNQDSAGPPERISAETAARAFRFIDSFLFPNARAVFASRLSATAEMAVRIAEHILARGHKKIDARSIEKALHKTKSDREEIVAAMEFLRKEDWIGKPSAGKNPKWDVDPRVHDCRFKSIADAERERRDAIIATIAATK